MARRTILLDTLTRHFVTFAKTMGIFPKVALRFKELAHWNGVTFYEKRSFYEYVRRSIRWSNCNILILNDNTIRDIYFRELYPIDNTNYRRHMKSVEESEMLLGLFMSYLRDKKIPRYIKILID